MDKQFQEKKTTTKKGINKRLFVLFILAIIMIIILLVSFFKINKKENTNELNNQETQEDVLPEIVPEEIPDTMGEYNVLGVITIEKLGLQKNILDKTTDSSLNLSVTKFYGPNLNEVGNFCITGHNYEDIFAYLGSLEMNDTFEIVDKANSKKVTYRIYDKYTVNPTELDCLNQETDGKREVTLITCNPGGVTRLILKAKEI